MGAKVVPSGFGDPFNRSSKGDYKGHSRSMFREPLTLNPKP